MSAERRTDNSDAASAGKPSGLRRVAGFVPTFLRAHVITLSIIVVLYTLAGFFLVPRIARSNIESYVTQTLHRKISLGEIRFNPYTFEASIAGLKLTENDGSPLVALRHLYVNAQLSSLWTRGAVLKEVELSAPDIQLVIARDGKVNLAQLVPASTEPEPAEESGPPRIWIGRLAVTQGRVGLEDRTRARPFTAAVTPIRFTLSDFKTDTGYRNAYRFAGTTTSGERLEWSGGFTVQPLGSSGQFQVRALKLATIDAYLYDSLPFKLASGEALLKGSYRFALDPLDVTLPLVAVRNMSVAERTGNGAPPVKVPEIDAQNLVLSLNKRDVRLHRLDIRSAHVDVAREPDGSISLSRLFEANAGAQRTSGSPPAATTANAAPQPSQPQQGESASDKAGSAESKSNWKIHVDTIALEGATVVAEDRAVTPAARFEVTPVGVTINGWSTDPRATLQVDANVTINEEGKLRARGDVQLEPPTTKLAIELADFGLPAVQPYLAPATAMTLHSGKLSAKGDLLYAGMPQAAPPLKFTGAIQVADLRTTDQLVNQDFVKWRNLAITGINFQQNPNRLSIDRIVARQPYASVIIAKDTSLNVTKVLSPRARAVDAPTPALPRDTGEGDADQQRGSKDRNERAASSRSPAGKAERDQQRRSKGGSTRKASPPPPAGEGQGGGKSNGAPFPVRIRAVQIIDGSANFADYSIEPSFATGILDLNGKVTGLSSDPASRAQVALQGKVDKYAPVDITGEANILAATKYTALAMNFRNMELTTFNPYSGKFAGYNISRGKLSTELKYKVEDRKLLAEHHIVLDNLEFGAKTESKDAAPIPIKLAVALLKDRNGVIDVNLPVSGTLDDPQFRLGPIIWKAVLGLLTKIVTAPFAALGALFGGGDELAYVDFAPGSAELSPPQAEKLTKLANALVERPQLKLNVPLTVVNAEDGNALAKQALAAQMPEGATAAPPDEAAKRKQVKTLEGLYKAAVKAAPDYPPETKTDQGPDLDAQLAYLEQGLLARLQPDPGALNALGQQRARAVQDAMLANTQLSPERVFITSQRAGAPAEGGRIRMEMKLE